MSPLRIVFAGTPQFAARHLQALHRSQHQLIAVYTQPDRPSGRGKKLLPSPVKLMAQEFGLSLEQPASLKSDEAASRLQRLNADLLVVVAYGLILPESILSIPASGCINVHASLLPRWRGAAPIERAILAGDEVTGITVMQMDAGLDTGAMLYKSSVEILPRDNRESLEEKLAVTGAQALCHVLENYRELRQQASPQDDALSTYAAKISKQEAAINWHDSADFINRQIRAGIGRYPAYSTLQGVRVRLLTGQPKTTVNSVTPGTVTGLNDNCLHIACGRGELMVSSLQFAGRNPVQVRDLINANPPPVKPGMCFSSPESTLT